MTIKLFKTDLHCHSKYSNKPSTWFHEWVKTGECYTTPKEVYRTAKRKGMDFVTITDHDTIRGAIELVEKHPEDSFISVEVTAFFPGDQARVHVLIWDISERQFLEIDRLRKDLFELRDYLKENRIVHSLAHATFDMDGLLTIKHLEQLVLLFDVFEGRNGGRGRQSNDTWVDYLKQLTPDQISDLVTIHRLEPMSEEPWLKGFTGGSDDHSGLFIGDTWTEAVGPSKEIFLFEVLKKRSDFKGDHSSPVHYTYGALKIAHEFANQAKGNYAESALGKAVHYFFYNSKLSLFGKFKLNKLKEKLRKKETDMGDTYYEFLLSIEGSHGQEIKDKLELNYHALSKVADAYFKKVLKALTEDPQKGQLLSMIKHLGAIFPHLALSLPFIASSVHLHGDRRLVSELRAKLNSTKAPWKVEKLLWFTDTLDDLNGVSETLKKIAGVATSEKMKLKLVAAETVRDLPLSNLIRLPILHEFEMPYYPSQKISIPSILEALKLIIDEEPDRIMISTPGPIGWIGLLAAWILKIPVAGVYHTDFSSQTRRLVGDETVIKAVEKYVNFFYQKCDTVWVPTEDYMQVLSRRGLERQRMKLFRRGLDTELFCPEPQAKETLRELYQLKAGPILLYAGRVSTDKNLNILPKILPKLLEKYPTLNLIVAGDGPYLQELKKSLNSYTAVVFTGRLEREKLPLFYQGSDLLVFPSATDTFGMVVYEAQACGLPCLVNELGGPKEIIKNSDTGWVVKGQTSEPWLEAVDTVIEKFIRDPETYRSFGQRAREHVLSKASWEVILKDYFVGPESPDAIETISLKKDETTSVLV